MGAEVPPAGEGEPPRTSTDQRDSLSHAAASIQQSSFKRGLRASKYPEVGGVYLVMSADVQAWPPLQCDILAHPEHDKTGHAGVYRYVGSALAAL